jgi:aminopeptidase N
VTKVSYGGTPTTFNDPDLGPGGFLHNSDGGVAIGEPDVAAAWFPVNDHPRDKATYTIRITAPSALSALANGVLTSKQAAAQAGWTTWTWRESAPMASYLATMVVGNYRLQQSTHDGKPVVTAVDTSLNNQIDTQLARTPEIIDFLATQFGPYPFDAMGGIVINDRRIQFALENQSRPIYSSLFFQGGDASTVIAHELAHQWYGDSVSLYDWKDIWLNEGFATYAEWLWEQHIGTNTPQQEFDYYYRSVPTSTLWTVAPAAPGPHMFGRDAYPSVYYRGAMALQALRITVGDDAFFAILKGWAAQEANQNATTEDFITFAEKTSGKPLHGLFQDWLYGTTKPPLPTK